MPKNFTFILFSKKVDIRIMIGHIFSYELIFCLLEMISQDDVDFDFDDGKELEPDEASEETPGTSLKTFVSQNTGWDEPTNGVTSTSQQDLSSKKSEVST